MLKDYFERGLILSPDLPCVIDASTGESMTYREADHLAWRVANALRANGFAVGDHAAVLSSNDIRAFLTTLAITRAGLIWIPLRPLDGASDLARTLGSFGCDILFVLSPFETKAEAIRAEVPRLRTVVTIDRATRFNPGLDDWIGQASAAPLETPYEPESVAAIQATGGTTGAAKGVALSHRSYEYVMASLIALYPARGRPIFLAALPLTHAAGAIAQSILARGGCVVTLPSFDVAAVLENIPKHQITHLAAVPAALYKLMDTPGFSETDFSSLQCVSFGGSTVSAAKLRHAVEIMGPVFYNTYGQTEGGMPLTVLGPDDYVIDGQLDEKRLESCGRPGPFNRLRIRRDDGSFADPNEPGEVVSRSSGTMNCYFENPEATADVFKDGWLLTGDIGTLDDHGFLRIVDRKKDMVITGGFNVFPAEIEAVLLSDPTVAEAAVIGVPSERWGEAIHACIEASSGAIPDTDALIALCKARLGSIKSPKTIEVLEQLPRSAVGKLLKRELRARYWTQVKRSI